MFKKLEEIFARPKAFEFYTARGLWDDEHISKRMLACHLDETVDLSSRKGEFIERSVEWIAERFGIVPGFRVADFGCGPGLYSAKLAARGAGVTGIDFSRNSIAHARKQAEENGLAIRYENLNYLEFETGERFDLIIMIMCDFCALSPEQRKVMLGKFHRFLKPGGAVLLDVYSHAAFQAREEVCLCCENLMDGFWSEHKYYGFMNTFKYADEKVVLDKYHIFEESGSKVIYNWLQYFSPKTLKAEFRSCGFSDIEVLGDVAGSQFDADGHEFAVVAVRD